MPVQGFFPLQADEKETKTKASAMSFTNRETKMLKPLNDCLLRQ